VSFENPNQGSVSSVYDQCDRCECTTNYNGIEYAECEQIDNVFGGGECPGTTEISCHVQDGWDNIELTANVTSEVCVSNQPEGWCEWSQGGDDDDEPDWGCHESPWCPIYGENGQCFYYEYEVTYDDCDGVEKTETDMEYTYCCNTDDCNFVDVDKTTCTKNEEISDLLQTLYECLVTTGADLDDDCDPFEEEEISCSSVVDLYGAQAECYCAAYSQLWADANDDWKPWIKDAIDGFMASFSGWNEPLGCTINIQCDVTTEGGDITVPGYNPSSASAMSGVYALLLGLLAALVRL